MITKENNNLYPKTEYKGYEYYQHNPSLNLHEYIEKIFKDVGIV